MRSIFVVIVLIINGAIFANDTFDSFYKETQKYQDITCIRTEINRINSEILRLLAERTAYVKRVGDLKSQTHKIAEDRQRISDQEKSIIEKSEVLKLPLEISLPTFRAIVEASTSFQQKYIDELTYP